MRPLDIRHIVVRKGALDLEVATPVEQMYVDERTARDMLKALPNLANHVCVNGRGETFGDDLVGTELPHLLEHAIIELQGQVRSPGDACVRPNFTGHTSWLAELAETRLLGYALMRVTVTFVDDFEALRAVERARAIIEAAVK